MLKEIALTGVYVAPIVIYLLLTLPLIGLNAWLERRYAVN